MSSIRVPLTETLALSHTEPEVANGHLGRLALQSGVDLSQTADRNDVLHRILAHHALPLLHGAGRVVSEA
jgi:hypothetical protein